MPSNIPVKTIRKAVNIWYYISICFRWILTLCQRLPIPLHHRRLTSSPIKWQNKLSFQYQSILFPIQRKMLQDFRWPSTSSQILRLLKIQGCSHKSSRLHQGRDHHQVEELLRKQIRHRQFGLWLTPSRNKLCQLLWLRPALQNLLCKQTFHIHIQ